MRLKKIADDDSQKLWVSDVFTDSDWPIYFFLRVQYSEYWGDDELVKSVGKYMVEVHAVSTIAAGEDNCKRAAESCGFGEWSDLSPVDQHQILMDYGVSARLYSTSGNNLGKLLRAARKELHLIRGILFGFKMDAPQNAIGNSGWDFIKGDIGFKANH
jgi:hypothetical protein